MCWLWLSLVKHRWVLAHSLYHEESLNTKTMAWINTKIWEAARSLGQADGRGSSPAFTCTETNIKVKENEETGKYVPNKRTKITSPETSLSKTEISDSSHTVVYKHTHTHTMKYYLAIKRKKILPARISKKLQDIMLSAISQRKTNTAWYHFYVESKKKKSQTQN